MFWPANLEDMTEYPLIKFFSSYGGQPSWIDELIGVFRKAEQLIITEAANQTGSKHKDSNSVLRIVAPGLRQLGYVVITEDDSESEKRRIRAMLKKKIEDEDGDALLQFEVDAWHREHGIVVEVEAGQAKENHNIQRDLIRAPLIPEANYCVVAVPLRYSYVSKGKRRTYSPFDFAVGLLQAIYESERPTLGLKGVLTIGY